MSPERDFYVQAAWLDGIKRAGSVTPSQQERLTDLLGQPRFLDYFLHDLDEPRLLGALEEMGVFAQAPRPQRTPEGLVRTPPWPASEYLVRIAPRAPTYVIDIAAGIDTDNFRVRSDLVEAACLVPPREAARLVPRVVEWLGSPAPGLDFLAVTAARLMSALAKGDQWPGALQLLRALTQPVLQSPKLPQAAAAPRPRTAVSYAQYELEAILRDTVRQLAHERPFDVLQVLEDQLAKAISLEYQDGPDLSWIWRPAIEDHPQNWGHGEIKDLLCEAVRDALVLAVSQSPDSARPKISAYLDHQHSIFRRLAIYTIGIDSEAFQSEFTRLFRTRRHFDDHAVRHEFFEMLSANFADLPRSAQAAVFSWIDAGPDLDAYARAFRTSTGKEPTAEDLDRRRDFWTLERLWLLRDSLQESEAQDLLRLTDTFGEPDHPEFPSYHTVTWVGPQSPIEPEQLRESSPAQVVQYLKKYRPDADPMGPSREGLGLTLEQVVKAAPGKYAPMAPKLLDEGVHPTYVYYFLSALRESWRAQRRFGWEPVMGLCERLVQRPYYFYPPDYSSGEREVPWRETRAAVADLLWAALEHRQPPHYLPKTYMTRCRDVLLTQLDDPHPAFDDEAKYGTGFMRGPNYAMNTVRGKAMNALVRYAARHARLNKAALGVDDGPALAPRGWLEPEVRSALTLKLDKTNDPSPAIHSIFGQYLLLLYRLDREWVTVHLQDIFPADRRREQYWQVAWDAYVVWTRPSAELYDLLSPFYTRAVRESPTLTAERQQASEALVAHVLSAYVEGHDDWSRPDALVRLLYDRAPTDLRKHATIFLWRVLADRRPLADDDLWLRLRDIWRNRVTAASQSPTPAAFSDELSQYALWLDSVPSTETLASLESLLRPIIPTLTTGMEVRKFVQYLSLHVEDEPALATEIFADLLRQQSDELGLRGAHETIRRLLASAMTSGCSEAASTAAKAINLLGEKGFYQYGELLDAS